MTTCVKIILAYEPLVFFSKNVYCVNFFVLKKYIFHILFYSCFYIQKQKLVELFHVVVTDKNIMFPCPNTFPMFYVLKPSDCLYENNSYKTISIRFDSSNCVTFQRG